MTDYFEGRSAYYRDGAYGHPLDTVLRRHRPRTVKESFVWAEILAQHSPHVYAVVRKYGEYPITKLKFSEVGSAEKKRHKELYEDHLKIRAFLGELSFDSWLYGNAFASLYEPFKRLLGCSRKSCGNEVDINAVEEYDFSLDKLTFKFDCPSCKQLVTGKVRDIPLPDPRRLNLIRWSPKQIDIKYNPLTNQSVYYYAVPPDIRGDVRKGDKHLINTMPMGMLRTIQKQKLFKFGEGNLFHIKHPSPSGLRQEWGMPPVVSAFELFLFTAALRRANEAIAMEHMHPFRVLYPQAVSANGDPIANVNLAEFKERVETAYKEFRQDPNRILVAPTAVGVQDIGGQGRAMMTFSELEAATKGLILAFGLPIEWVEGGMGQVKGEVTLRQIENQLQNHIDGLNGFLRWVEGKTSSFLGAEPIDVRLSDFKMVDDSERKAFILQLWGQGKYADSLVYEMFEIDPDMVREQRKQDTINDLRAQLELEHEQKKLTTSLGQKAIQQAQATQGPLDYNDTAQVIAAADQKVQELLGLDDGSRRSQMDSLQGQAPILYAVVKDRMEQAQQDQDAQMKAQAQGVA